MMEFFQANNRAGSLIDNAANLSNVAFIDPQQLALMPDAEIVGVVTPNNEQTANAQWYSSPQRNTLLQLNEAALQTESSSSECTAACQASALSDKISAINSTVVEDDIDWNISDDDASIGDDNVQPRFAGVERIKRPHPMTKDEQISTIASLRQKLKDFPPVPSQLQTQSQATAAATAVVSTTSPNGELPGETTADYSLFTLSPCKTAKKVC